MHRIGRQTDPEAALLVVFQQQHAELGVVAVQAHDDRPVEVRQGADGGDDALSDGVAGGDAAEDVDEEIYNRYFFIIVQLLAISG